MSKSLDLLSLCDSADFGGFLLHLGRLDLEIRPLVYFLGGFFLLRGLLINAVLHAIHLGDLSVRLRGFLPWRRERRAHHQKLLP